MTPPLQNFIDTHKPKTLKEIYGQDQALERLKQSALMKKPALVYGPTGCGKTASVYALAQELDYELIEINASDVRNKEGIQSIIGSSLHQTSLFAKGKIILIDEVDSIAGNKDRGGVPALVELLSTAKQAVVMTANNPWDSKFSSLRKSSVLIEFSPVPHSIIYTLLAHLCAKEKISLSEDLLKKISRKANGDVRAAILDLQALSSCDEKALEGNMDFLDDRLREQSISEALRLVFKSTKPYETLGSFDRVDCDLPEVMLWLEENLPREYARADLTRGFDALSKADIFHGRILRWQHWRFLVYMNNFLTAGIASAKEQKTIGFIEYKRNSRILRLWMAKQKRLKLQGIMQQLPGEIHGSSRQLTREVLPYVRYMARKNKRMTFGLSKEDALYLAK